MWRAERRTATKSVPCCVWTACVMCRNFIELELKDPSGLLPTSPLPDRWCNGDKIRMTSQSQTFDSYTQREREKEREIEQEWERVC